jgi:hypothetical protein
LRCGGSVGWDILTHFEGVVAQLVGIFYLNLRCGGSVGWDILAQFVVAQLAGIFLLNLRV